MDYFELKRNMMELWKNTFHDSDDYISLVFDNYYDPDFIEFHIEGEKLIAAMLAIPYEFGNLENKVRAVYLCGLATIPEYQDRGIMSAMIERICQRMSEKGYAFVFLIPANSGLRKYYYDRKFVNAFYRNVIRYVPNHEFTKDYRSIIEINDLKLLDEKLELYRELNVYRIENLNNLLSEYTYKNIDNIDDFISYILEKESIQTGLKIFQNNFNLKIVIQENIISKGNIYYIKNNGGRICGIVFIVFENDEILIPQVYVDNIAIYFRILDNIKTDFPEKSIKIFVDPCSENRNVFWRPYYDNVMESAPQVMEISEIEEPYRPSENAEIYGLARILDFYEILKFMTNQRRDLKFSILVKEDESKEILNFRSKNGLVEKRIVSKENCSMNEVMSETELAALIFRRVTEDSSMITDVMGIPPAEGWISLMLD